MMLWSLGALLVSGAGVTAAALDARWPQTSLTIPNLSNCTVADLVYSCENTTAIRNTCCSPTPGGLALSTQFWSTYTGLEDKGQLLPENSWTLHGLWPDFCDGSFTQYCDLTRQYDPQPSPNTTNGLANGTVVPPWTGPTIDTFIEAFGRYELLRYMNTYWINQGAPNTAFWAHEFSKHATCTSTFDVKCFSNYQEHEDVINFFDAAIRAFKQFPTFTILAASGIYPSNTTTYTLSQLQNAIHAQTGGVPYLGCTGPQSAKNDGRTILDEVWYFTHVLGTPQYGRFKVINSTTTSSCTSTGGITYPLRASGSERKVHIQE